MSHSPLPWVRELDLENPDPDCRCYIVSDDGREVCCVPIELPDDCDEELANSSLLLSAPDLLEACKDALDFVNGEPLGVNALEFILTAAIHKAEGES